MTNRIATPDTVLNFTSVAAHIVDETGAVDPAHAERAILEVALALFSAATGSGQPEDADAIQRALVRVSAVSPLADRSVFFGCDEVGRVVEVHAKTGKFRFRY